MRESARRSWEATSYWPVYSSVYEFTLTNSKEVQRLHIIELRPIILLLLRLLTYVTSLDCSMSWAVP